MAVSLQVNSTVEEIGTSDFFHAFFSTISSRLEPNGWGSRYPELMNELYQGRLDRQYATKVLHDVAEIRDQLKLFPPNEVVWDIDNPSAQPPWGDNISEDITDLSNYFVTSTGRDVFEVLRELLEHLEHEGSSLTIVES